MHPSDRGDAQHTFTLHTHPITMSMSPPIPIPVAITPVAVPAVAVPIAIPIAILFAVPVLSAIERQEQCERIGRTSLLEKRLIIIQQLIVINKGRFCSFDKASV
jgi:hypothetical protein